MQNGREIEGVDLSARIDRCDHCNKPGELGASLRTHAIEIPAHDDRFAVVLHVDRCTSEWFAAYEMNGLVHACAQCKENGRLGPEIRAYSFVKPNGASYTVFLHASDGGKDCYSKYDARYRAKFAKAKEAASG